MILKGKKELKMEGTEDPKCLNSSMKSLIRQVESLLSLQWLGLLMGASAG